MDKKISQKKKKKKGKKIVPSISLEGPIPKGEGYQSQEYKDQKWLHDEQIKLRNKQRSIQRMLRKLRKRKYLGFDTVMIDGEIWDIESGKPVSELKKGKKKEFAPDRIFEEMVKEESG